MNTILSRLAETIQKVKSQPITDHEKNELKNAILDRIGCGLGARRLAVGQEMSSYLKKNHCPGGSTVWGTDTETQAHLAALVNGASSSHLEYDSHDSMIPAAVALGEIHGATGELLLQSLKIGYITGVILRRLLASEIERRGLHWPAYIAAFVSSAACSNILGSTIDEAANAMSIAAALSPVAPFESFTRGATVKDLYGGWGNMLGVQSAQLGGLGLTGPITLFEGDRGLFRNWLDGNPDAETVDAALDIGEIEMVFHIKPFPCCTSAHPALSALEKLISENPSLNPDEIERVEIETYRFGADLSDESNPDTPIGAKVNIPFLTASMLVHGRLLPEHSERPWILDEGIRGLADRIHVEREPGEDELLTRRRSASVVGTLKDGERLKAHVETPHWSDTRATQTEIRDKFRENVGNFYSVSRVERIIFMVDEIEQLEDLREFTELLRARCREDVEHGLGGRRLSGQVDL
jgi:2-methylcitrate dehydratase PrpD